MSPGGSRELRLRSRVGPRVLLGMANTQRRAALARCLRDSGHRVTAARDGYHLVQLMATALLDESGGTPRPDLIIADLTMPGCLGTTILDGIRQLQWDTPVFLIVDFNQPDMVAQALDHGADSVFEKPVDIEDVRMCADAALFGPFSRAVTAASTA